MILNTLAAAALCAGLPSGAEAFRCILPEFKPSWWVDGVQHFNRSELPQNWGNPVILYGTFTRLDHRQLEHEADFEHRLSRLTTPDDKVREAGRLTYRYENLIEFVGFKAVNGKIERIRTKKTSIEFSVILGSDVPIGEIRTGPNLATVAYESGHYLNLKAVVCPGAYREMTPDDFTRLLECVNDARC